MEQIEINGNMYLIGRLNALDQMHVSRKIAPLVPTLMPLIAEVAKGDLENAIKAIEESGDNADLSDLGGLSEALKPMMEALSHMPESDVNYVTHKCLSVVKRGSAVVCRGETIMFDDLDMLQILPLIIAVIRKNLGNFIQGLLMKASSIQAQQG